MWAAAIPTKKAPWTRLASQRHIQPRGLEQFRPPDHKEGSTLDDPCPCVQGGLQSSNGQARPTIRRIYTWAVPISSISAWLAQTPPIPQRNVRRLTWKSRYPTQRGTKWTDLELLGWAERCKLSDNQSHKETFPSFFCVPSLTTLVASCRLSLLCATAALTLGWEMKTPDLKCSYKHKSFMSTGYVPLSERWTNWVLYVVDPSACFYHKYARGWGSRVITCQSYPLRNCHAVFHGHEWCSL